MKNKERCRRRLPMDVNDESGSRMKKKQNKSRPVQAGTFEAGLLLGRLVQDFQLVKEVIYLVSKTCFS